MANIQQGQLKLEDGDYVGEIYAKMPHGYGTLTYTASDDVVQSYEGQWQKGDRYGQGRLTFKDGNYCEGEWVEDEFVYGVLTYDECYYIGQFKNGLRHGKGRYVVDDQTYCDGEWENDDLIFGKDVDKFGHYVGSFKGGRPHGMGEEKLNNGRSWKGMWQEGRKVACEQSDPIPNAVRIWPLGNMDLIRIDDFSTGEGLGKPLNCNRVDIISTAEMRELAEILQCPVVAYIDSNARQKEIANNTLMCELSGYEYLPGACILCGWENGDYAPLDYQVAEMFFDCIRDVQEEDGE